MVLRRKYNSDYFALPAFYIDAYIILKIKYHPESIYYFHPLSLSHTFVVIKTTRAKEIPTDSLEKM